VRPYVKHDLLVCNICARSLPVAITTDDMNEAEASKYRAAVDERWPHTEGWRFTFKSPGEEFHPMERDGCGACGVPIDGDGQALVVFQPIADPADQHESAPEPEATEQDRQPAISPATSEFIVGAIKLLMLLAVLYVMVFYLLPELGW
jgi:hypothetical protein